MKTEKFNKSMNLSSGEFVITRKRFFRIYYEQGFEDFRPVWTQKIKEAEKYGSFREALAENTMLKLNGTIRKVVQ